MESVRDDLNYKTLKKEHKVIVDIILKDQNFKNDMKFETENGDQVDDLLPYPIFKISELPSEEKALEWFQDKNKLRIPTFVGKLKEVLFNIRPQLILEDDSGKTIKIIINIEEEFEEIQQRLLDLRYEVGGYVFVYDAFRLPMIDESFCLIVDSFQRMSNERWICRWKPRRGVSAKYVPKIIFALILLSIAWYNDWK